MPKALLPTEADLEVVIRSLGLFDDDGLTEVLQFLDLATFADAAVSQWERETGWIPFLKDAADVTRFFDPPGPNTRPHTLGGGYQLELGAGLLTLTSITTGVTSTSAGSVLTSDDFTALPRNAAAISRPWTAIDFTVAQWGSRNSIKIIGRFGHSATVPDDVWLAISHRAVGIALPEIATYLTGGGATKFQELGVVENIPDAFLIGKDRLGSVWGLEWERAVRRYTRITL